MAKKCIFIRVEYDDGSAEWAAGDHADEVWSFLMASQTMNCIHGAVYHGRKMESSPATMERPTEPVIPPTEDAPNPLSTEEIRERIKDLETHYRMTSAEMVEKWKAKEVPPEAHFVEWLVFLDRGDLLNL